MNEWNCSAVQDVLPEYTAGVLDGEMTSMVRAHLIQCDDCRQEADLVANLRTNVRLPAGLDERVVAAVRAGAVGRVSPRWRVKHVAMAATVAFAAITGSWIWQNAVKRDDTTPPDVAVLSPADEEAHAVLRSPGLGALSEEELLKLLKEIES